MLTYYLLKILEESIDFYIIDFSKFDLVELTFGTLGKSKKKLVKKFSNDDELNAYCEKLKKQKIKEKYFDAGFIPKIKNISIDPDI